jgi:DNA repair protein RadC
MKYTSIRNWASDDRPREKLLANGVNNLSNAELLAILLGSGTRETSAVELSRQLLQKADNNLAELGKYSVAELTKIKGIGEAKAVSIVAAFEIGKRRCSTDISDRLTITSSKDVYNYFHPIVADLVHEEFWALYLNRSNKIIEKYKLSQGGVSGTVTDIRLLLKRAIELLASSLIVCHNHPSGNINPSENDTAITNKIKVAASQMDIRLLDHVIIANNSYFSFTDEGILSDKS